MRLIDHATDTEIRDALPANLHRIVPARSDIPVYECLASELLSPRRLDLIIKRRFALSYLGGTQSDFISDLYQEHIRVFNGFVERDGSGKRTPEGFKSSFEKLISSLRDEGYDPGSPIPLAQDGTLVDGAHRAAACMALGTPVRVFYTTLQHGPAYDSDYFASRGMAEWALDSAASDFALMDATSRMILVWPTAQGRRSELETILTQYAELIFGKELFLSGEAPLHLVSAAYERETWLGDSNNGYAGARNKAMWCFDGAGPLRAFLVQPRGDLLQCKEEVRKLFQKNKHSIHITDDSEETIALAEMLLNSNSLHMISHAPLQTYAWFHRLFSHYDSWLSNVSADDSQNYCVDGSAILAIYGVREARDLDYLYVGTSHRDSEMREISLHSDAADYYSRPISEMVNDPRRFFYYKRRKVLSLDSLIEFKRARGEAKDLDDIAMVDRVLLHGRTLPPLRERLRQVLHPSHAKRRIKILALKARYHAQAAWARRPTRTKG